MLIKLPRQCSGQEVVEAFKDASTFQEKPDRKWDSHMFIGEFQYEPGSVRQTVRSMGVRALPSSLRKKWGVFGQKVWKLDSNAVVVLNPVELSNRYDEVRVAVEYVYDVDQGGHEYVATDPSTPEFEYIRVQLEKILDNFYVHLHLQESAAAH